MWQARREAFAAWLPLGGVPLSYAIAIGYVLVDTADKGVKAFQLAQQELGGNAALHPEVDTPRCVRRRGLVIGPTLWESGLELGINSRHAA